MYVSEMKDYIFRSTNNQYNDTFHMLALLNDGLNELVEAARLRTNATLSIMANVNVYDKPSDFKAPYILQDETDPNSVITYPLVSIGENTPGYAIEDKIYIKPIPSQDKNLKLYYYKYATPLVNDNDEPTDIDSQYHYLLPLYANSQIIPLIKSDTTTRYSVMAANLADSRAWQRWLDGKQNFISAMTKKNRLSRIREKVVW